MRAGFFAIGLLVTMTACSGDDAKVEKASAGGSQEVEDDAAETKTKSRSMQRTACSVSSTTRPCLEGAYQAGLALAKDPKFTATASPAACANTHAHMPGILTAFGIPL